MAEPFSRGGRAFMRLAGRRLHPRHILGIGSAILPERHGTGPWLTSWTQTHTGLRIEEEEVTLAGLLNDLRGWVPL